MTLILLIGAIGLAVGSALGVTIGHLLVGLLIGGGAGLIVGTVVYFKTAGHSEDVPKQQ